MPARRERLRSRLLLLPLQPRRWLPSSLATARARAAGNRPGILHRSVLLHRVLLLHELLLSELVSEQLLLHQRIDWIRYHGCSSVRARLSITRSITVEGVSAL